MSVAPQRWILLYCKLACHGQSPVSAEDNPPTIRNDDAFAIDLTDLFCRNPQMSLKIASALFLSTFETVEDLTIIRSGPVYFLRPLRKILSTLSRSASLQSVEENQNVSKVSATTPSASGQSLNPLAQVSELP